MMMKSFFPFTIVALTSSWIIAAEAPSAKSEASPIRFNRDVLPILAENCFACHGFDPAAREADLRLDTREGALSNTNGTPAIQPGDPEASLVIARILSPDPDEVMPPPKTGKRLSDSERETLRQWIAQGAAYEKHWSFMAPVRETPPSIPGVTHPIDRFIQARLAEVELTPSERASSATLMRRVSLDLIGLPPTIQELDRFLRESAKDEQRAYRELVDRLSSSPHYGERWGRWWLDQARYADSNGYSIDAHGRFGSIATGSSKR